MSHLFNLDIIQKDKQICDVRKRSTFQNVWRQSSGKMYLNFDIKRFEKYSFSYGTAHISYHVLIRFIISSFVIGKTFSKSPPVASKGMHFKTKRKKNMQKIRSSTKTTLHHRWPIKRGLSNFLEKNKSFEFRIFCTVSLFWDVLTTQNIWNSKLLSQMLIYTFEEYLGKQLYRSHFLNCKLYNEVVFTLSNS